MSFVLRRLGALPKWHSSCKSRSQLRITLPSSHGFTVLIAYRVLNGFWSNDLPGARRLDCTRLNLERKHDEEIKRPTRGECEASSL
jgi:hypothetical protein